MSTKLLILVLLLLCMAGGMLMLRQHRIELAHRSARLTQQIHQTRQHLWRKQTHAAAMLTPESLKQRISQLRVVYEPAVPEPARAESAYARRP